MLELATDGLGELEGIESGAQLAQLAELLTVGIADGQEAIERCLGSVVDSLQARADADLSGSA